LAGCAGQKPQVGEEGNVEGFLGGAVAVEPNATLAAQDVLSAGGTAADAAAAAYFTLAVAYPYGASLGGGGICIYYDSKTNKAEALDFLPRPPRGGGEIAVPGNLRGVAALHSRYGRLRWAQLIAPAETLARFGFPTSRALATRVSANVARLKADPAAAKLLMTPAGTPLAEAEPLVQIGLSAVLTRLRTKGVGDFYGGELGRRFLADIEKTGAKIDLTDLRGFVPKWLETGQTKSGNEIVHFPPVTAAATALRELMGKPSADAIVAAGPAVLPASAGHDPQAGDASVLVADRHGSAAACAFTMNGAFGNGRLMPLTGIFAAPARPEMNIALAPVIVANHNTDQAFMAVVGSGGPAGLLAAAQTVVSVRGRRQGLADAIAAPRRFRFPDGDIVEDKVGELPSLGRVQAFACPSGLRDGGKGCRFATDPRGHGLVGTREF
jgi:gamma-glutamyltranspeptidase/glutathione hydrolase